MPFVSNIFYLESHPFNFVQNKIVGYERWAIESRAWVERSRNSRSADELTALDAGTKAAFETLSRRYDTLERKLLEKEVAQQEKDRANNDKITSLQATVDTLKTDIATVIQLLQNQQGDNPRPPQQQLLLLQLRSSYSNNKVSLFFRFYLFFF